MKAPWDGEMITRMVLRKARRESTDPKVKVAIDAALADPDFCAEQTSTAIGQLGLDAISKDVPTLPAGWLQQLMKFLIDNLPAIIALIMALFSGA